MPTRTHLRRWAHGDACTALPAKRSCAQALLGLAKGGAAAGVSGGGHHQQYAQRKARAMPHHSCTVS